TFAPVGVVWLSGRITGGHLLGAAWHAGAFAWLADALERGGPGRAAVLGLWCGLGLYLDSMFAVTLAGLVPAVAGAWVLAGVRRRGLLLAAVAALGFVAGYWPKPLGAWVDPHDAYREQFEPVTSRELIAGHSRILLLECLPRLLAGHRLPGLETDPDPAGIG